MTRGGQSAVLLLDLQWVKATMLNQLLNTARSARRRSLMPCWQPSDLRQQRFAGASPWTDSGCPSKGMGWWRGIRLKNWGWLWKEISSACVSFCVCSNYKVWTGLFHVVSMISSLVSSSGLPIQDDETSQFPLYIYIYIYLLIDRQTDR